MIILGSKDIPYEDIEEISSIQDIPKTKANSTLLFDYDIELLKYCYNNTLSYAVNISSIKEAIFSNSLGAKYILPKLEDIKVIQSLAENYMFDSKVLATINDEDQIEQIALQNIDGVFLR